MIEGGLERWRLTFDRPDIELEDILAECEDASEISMAPDLTGVVRTGLCIGTGWYDATVKKVNVGNGFVITVELEFDEFDGVRWGSVLHDTCAQRIQGMGMGVRSACVWWIPFF